MHEKADTRLFNYISSFFTNPRAMFIVFLIALPGRLMAITLHEFSHGWVAHKCGDDTAYMLGRLTLNPIKHLDVVGTIMMLVFGFGWAKPVPVNPRNFRNYRRDDLLVSIAGITMNFIMFVLSMIVMYTVLGIALAQVSGNGANDAIFLQKYLGQMSVIYQKGADAYYIPVADTLKYAAYMSQDVIAPLWGSIAGYVYDMLMYFALTNLVLFIFNLIPVPPLDGYHVLNDLVLRKTNVFASERASQIGFYVLMALMFTGTINTVIGFLQNAMLSGAGTIAQFVFSALGII